MRRGDIARVPRLGARLGYAGVRVHAGGTEDRAQAGLAFEGSRARTTTGTISGAAAVAGRAS